MRLLKQYSVLYDLYRRRVVKLKILTLICLLFVPLAFATIFLGNFPFGLQLAMLGMIFPAIMFAMMWLISSVRTRKFLKAFSPPQLNTINREAASCEKCEGLFVTSHAVIVARFGLDFILMSNVLWVYLAVITNKLEGLLPIGKESWLVFKGRDHKQRFIRIKNNQKAYDFMQTELLKHRQDIIFGYEGGLDNIYKHQIQRMIDFNLEYAEKRDGGSIVMNTDYLNTLPEIKNKFNVELEPGEKVVFATKPRLFGTGEGGLLGTEDSRITMTNRRIMADNGKGLWTTDIKEDVVDMRRQEEGKFIMKSSFILVTLNKEVVYGMGIQKLSGFRFYFKKKDMAAFEEIIRHLV